MQTAPQPRTAKKLVLFVGRRHPATGAWSFDLDPRLTWDDVSEETKRRLSLLPEEAARTYARKYPHRAPGGWTRRPQKYAAPGGGAGGVVPLGELVSAARAGRRARPSPPVVCCCNPHRRAPPLTSLAPEHPGSQSLSTLFARGAATAFC
jgi:hypothetical protein